MQVLCKYYAGTMQIQYADTMQVLIICTYYAGAINMQVLCRYYAGTLQVQYADTFQVLIICRYYAGTINMQVLLQILCTNVPLMRGGRCCCRRSEVSLNGADGTSVLSLRITLSL